MSAWVGFLAEITYTHTSHNVNDMINIATFLYGIESIHNNCVLCSFLLCEFKLEWYVTKFHFEYKIWNNANPSSQIQQESPEQIANPANATWWCHFSGKTNTSHAQ